MTWVPPKGARLVEGPIDLDPNAIDAYRPDEHGRLWLTRKNKSLKKLRVSHEERRQLRNYKPWLPLIPEKPANATNGRVWCKGDLEHGRDDLGWQGFCIEHGRHREVSVAICSWKGVYVEWATGLNGKEMRQLRKDFAAVGLLPFPFSHFMRAIDGATPEEAKYLLQFYKWSFARELAPPKSLPAWSEKKKSQFTYKEYRHTTVADGTHSIAIAGLGTWDRMHSKKAWAKARQLEDDGLKRSRDSISREGDLDRPRVRSPSRRS